MFHVCEPCYANLTFLMGRAEWRQMTLKQQMVQGYIKYLTHLPKFLSAAVLRHLRVWQVTHVWDVLGTTVKRLVGNEP